MRHETYLIQDLLVGLQELKEQRSEILIQHQLPNEVSMDLIPVKDKSKFQRVQKEYEAKQSYLAEMTGQNDVLRILLDQLSRLSELRERILLENSVENPIALPIKDWTEYLKLWDMTDKVAELLDLSLESSILKPI